MEQKKAKIAKKQEAAQSKCEAEAAALLLEKEAAELKAKAKAEADVLVKQAESIKAQTEAELTAMRQKAEAEAEELLQAGLKKLEASRRAWEEEEAEKKQREEAEFFGDKIVVDIIDSHSDSDNEEWQKL